MSDLLKCPNCGGDRFIAETTQTAFYKVSVDKNAEIEWLDLDSSFDDGERPTEVYCRQCDKDIPIFELVS